MKLYISFDVEGLAGITNWDQEEEERDLFLRSVHQQIAYVIEGIQTSPKNDQIETITLADAHGRSRSLDYHILGDLDPRIQLICGRPRKEFMVHGIGGHDLAFFVGYHGGSGQQRANMDHTFSSCVHQLNINGIKCNEALVNAIYAKEMGVPVGLIIGDSGLYDQLILEGYMPYVDFVTTKKSISRFACKFKNPQVLRKETIEAVHRVLAQDPSKLSMPDMASPYLLTLEFNTTDQADRAAIMPGVQRMTGYKLSLSLERASDLINTISVLTRLARD
ncbi:MAG: M55 family metallopeptidase [Tissierellia bacterium]|nr:M55 family metallopeptidase [Tissierellia bacterium]